MKTLALKTLNPRHPDTKYVGSEPQWAEQPTDNRISELSRAFNWYNYFYGKKEAKDMIVAYLERHERTADAKRIRALADSKIRLTAGWTCRMIDMGLVLNEREQKTLDSMLTEMLTQRDEPVAEAVAEPEVTNRVTIQDRLREKVTECAGELEGMYDDFVAAGARLTADFKPVALIRGMNIAPQMIHIIRDIWTRRQSELELAAAGKDPQLAQGYGHLTKTQLKNCIKFCELVVTDCGSYVQIKKVERKPRKVKPVPLEKRVARFKFQTEFPDLKLKSLPATSLVDKSEAWLYDTKKRKLIHIVADEYAKVFTIKSNSIIGFSTADTQQKTVRKPAETIRQITAAGKPAARKIFKELTTTETAWNARGTENLIILKAW